MYLNASLKSCKAFRGTDLEELYLPASVTHIDIQAFPDLLKLKVHRDTYGASYAITNGFELEFVD